LLPRFAEKGASEGRPVDGDFRLGDRFGPPDVEPEAVEPDAKQPAPGGGGVEERRKPEDVRRLVSKSSGLMIPTPV
jgi:hypothetical protein